MKYLKITNIIDVITKKGRTDQAAFERMSKHVSNVYFILDEDKGNSSALITYSNGTATMTSQVQYYLKLSNDEFLICTLNTIYYFKLMGDGKGKLKDFLKVDGE